MRARSLGFWTLSSLAIGNMVGAGIFLLPASLAAIGSITLYSWIISTIGTLLLAFVFVELNQRFNESGGPFTYVQNTFGDGLGFVIASIYCFAWILGNTAMVVAAVGYLGSLIPAVQSQEEIGFFIKVAIIWFVIGINILGIKISGHFQVLTTLIKVVPLAAIATVGLFHLQWDNLTQYFNRTGSSDGTALISGLALTLWAYVGFESAVIPSEESSGPLTVKKATLFSFFIVAFLYMAGSLVLLGMIPASILQQSQAPYADAAVKLFGPGWDTVVNICVIIAILGAINGSVFVNVHVAVAAAKKSLFPSKLSMKNRFGVPARGFIICGLIMTFLLFLTFNQTLLDQFNFIVALSAFAFLVSYYIVAVGHLAVISKEKRKRALSFLAVAYSFFAMLGAGKDVVFYGIFLFFFAFILCALFKKGIQQKSGA